MAQNIKSTKYPIEKKQSAYVLRQNLVEAMLNLRY